MKKCLILLFLTLIAITSKSQEASTHQVNVTPNGLSFNNGKKQLIIDTENSALENTNRIVKNLKSKNISKNFKVDTINNAIIISDFIQGYTKTDKSAGSAYQLDLSYKINVDVKDKRIRINLPEILIAANQKYDSNAVIVNKGVQFNIEMGIKGKRDVWNSKEKKMFIYDEKDKLVEKSTKDKLERDLSEIVEIISKQEISEW